MRIGELLAIKRENINYEDKTLDIIYGGTFGIYPKADASTQNSSSVQDKQFQKVEEVPNNSEKAL
ncbi:hypothetical protein INO64_13905, partial [Staphylococcus aureus]|nr:hypothetical protein [Staphylococcus aureus]